jgi:hypothetical protein
MRVDGRGRWWIERRRAVRGGRYKAVRIANAPALDPLAESGDYEETTSDLVVYHTALILLANC